MSDVPAAACRVLWDRVPTLLSRDRGAGGAAR